MGFSLGSVLGLAEPSIKGKPDKYYSAAQSIQPHIEAFTEAAQRTGHLSDSNDLNGRAADAYSALVIRSHDLVRPIPSQLEEVARILNDHAVSLEDLIQDEAVQQRAAEEAKQAQVLAERKQRSHEREANRLQGELSRALIDDPNRQLIVDQLANAQALVRNARTTAANAIDRFGAFIGIHNGLCEAEEQLNRKTVSGLSESPLSSDKPGFWDSAGSLAWDAVGSVVDIAIDPLEAVNDLLSSIDGPLEHFLGTDLIDAKRWETFLETMNNSLLEISSLSTGSPESIRMWLTDPKEMLDRYGSVAGGVWDFAAGTGTFLYDASSLSPTNPAFYVELYQYSQTGEHRGISLVTGMGQLGYQLSSLSPYSPTFWTELEEVLRTRSLANHSGINTGVAMAVAVVDWETFRDDPSRWVGRMAPEVLLEIATGGASPNLLDNVANKADNIVSAADNVAGTADNAVGAADNVADDLAGLTDEAIAKPPERPDRVPVRDPDWKTPETLRKPADARGTWDGDVGNSNWTPEDPAHWGLKEGESVNFVNGTPDFYEHVPDTLGDPSLGRAEVDVKFTGDRRKDNKLAIETLAEQTGIPEEEVARWVDDNNLEMHHNGCVAQFVPKPTHNVAHEGGVKAIKSGDLKC